ncbi:hypothetical protein [Priestia flexa]|uniref:hypothetical protein n=1 Tax=Priestia flexa TaxID=86664 RepID=UPI00077C91D8|nr:hypothetical protein [Priestia flexa]MED4587875.1 hypothetical protein [Priestia flexa]
MRKSTLTAAIIALVLSACGSNGVSGSNSFNGTWEKAEGEPAVCRDSFTFKGDNVFEIQNSRAQGGETSSGTYKNVEENDYQFDYGGASDMFTIEIEGNSMTAQMAGSKNVCKYNKEK